MASRAIPAPEGLHTENGGTYLIVDGMCNFFVNLSDRIDRWPEVRTGNLSADEVARLASRLQVSRWSQLGEAAGSNPAVDHPTLSVWSNGRDIVSCLDACEAQHVREMLKETRLATDELWAKGASLGGAMRISMARDGTSMRLDAAAAMAVAWPLSLPLDSAVLPPSEGRYPGGGMGLLVNNPNDLSDLRAIRRAFQDLPEGAWWYGFVPIKASADASRYDFILHMRDAVPYEDTRGRIPLTW